MINVVEYGKSRKFKSVILACLYLALKGNIKLAKELFNYSLYGEVSGTINISKKEKTND